MWKTDLDIAYLGSKRTALLITITGGRAFEGANML